MILNTRNSRGLGATLNYYEMPDATTQAIIAARGDSIQIVPDTRVADAQAAAGWLEPPPPPVKPVLANASPTDTATINANIAAMNLYGDQLALYLAAQNAHNDPTSYAQYMGLVAAGQIPVTQAQTPVVTTGGNVSTPLVNVVQNPIASTNQGLAPSLAFTNLSGGNNAQFKVGDRWRLDFTGKPGDALVVTGGKGGARDTTNMGSIGSDGRAQLSGTFGTGDVGDWSESWMVGSTYVGGFNFSVAAVQSAVPTTITPAQQLLPAAVTNVTDSVANVVDSIVKSITPAAGSAAGGSWIKGSTAGIPNVLLIGSGLAAFFFMKGRN